MPLRQAYFRITLTKRNNGGANEELAGFPTTIRYVPPKLVRRANGNAICDQLEDPSQAKGIVKRGVTELRYTRRFDE
jgi:DNA mismatch repair protein MutS